MLPNTSIQRPRVASIDILRGLAMVVMALDHSRDYFSSANVMNLATVSPQLFFTRWITDFCAPIFVFLSGTSICLQAQRKPAKELQGFLVKRGLWLIAVEIGLISFGWTFDPSYTAIILQVIWVIGLSMILMAALVRLPLWVPLILGLVLCGGHNLLDQVERAPGFQPGFWDNLLHHAFYAVYPIGSHHELIILYALLPWTGVMLLGYCCGALYRQQVDPARRRRLLRILGLSLLGLFVLLRALNGYGNPFAWQRQHTLLYTFLDFIQLSKYPPSLMYDCLFLGPSLLALAALETIRNRITGVLEVFGRVAFFYYILHIFLIHLLSMLVYLAAGHSFASGLQPAAGGPPFLFMASTDSYSLPVVYLVWMSVVLALYPLCRWYNAYKHSHRERWYLSYL